MITITSRAVVSETSIERYCVSGHELVSQASIDGLKAFAIAASILHNDRSKQDVLSLISDFGEPELPSIRAGKPYYKGSAYFEGVSRCVEYWRHEPWAQIDVDGTPVCLVNLLHSHIHVLNENPLGLGLNFEVVTGPALILLLAQRSVYCLHAGSVDTAAGRIGIMAESGVGKSTLSAHGGDKWQQICDDIMPLSYDQNSATVTVLPTFPQLKLNGKTVSGFPMPDAALDFIVRINPVPSAQTRFAVLPKPHAMLEIIRHTVASKLFSAEQLKQHTEFAQKIASEVPVIEVSYPRELSQLSELRERIVVYLESLK